jgi:type VI protein secretion system component VasF
MRAVTIREAKARLNALVEAANPILAVVAQIRHALRHPDPAGLRANLRAKIDAFESTARAAGVRDDAVPGERVVVARREQLRRPEHRRRRRRLPEGRSGQGP